MADFTNNAGTVRGRTNRSRRSATGRLAGGGASADRHRRRSTWPLGSKAPIRTETAEISLNCRPKRSERPPRAMQRRRHCKTHERRSAGIAGQFAVFTDPQQNVERLSEHSPFLLFPVRIETRFRTIVAQAPPGIAVPPVNASALGAHLSRRLLDRHLRAHPVRSPN